MKKKVLFIITILLIPVSIFTQDQTKEQSVELPDFIITGKDKINIQIAKKSPPDFISTISEEFLKPVLAPEDLPLAELSSPIKKEATGIDSIHFIKGKADIAVGLYSLPKGNIYYTYGFNNGLIRGFFNGLSQRPYEENTGRYEMKGGFNSSYFIINNNSFLPGTHFNLKGTFGRNSYRFFGEPGVTAATLFKRDLDEAEASFEMKNVYNKIFRGGFEVKDKLIMIQNDNFTENNIGFNAFADMNFDLVKIRTKAEYKMQSLDVNSLKADYDYFNANASIEINISKIMKARFGFLYAQSDSSKFISPVAALGLQLDKGITFYGEYTPSVDFLTNAVLLNQNPYFIPGAGNLFVKNNNVFSLSVKYEYDKFFEINGGFKFRAASNYPYFEDDGKGKFNVKTTDARSFGGFLNLLFHLGPYGVFYGDIIFTDTRDTSNNHIPYSPALIANLSYGYSFSPKLIVESKIFFASESFSDLQNSSKINHHIDLGLKFTYRYASKMDLYAEVNNIINNNNYYWFGYKEKPVDISAGIVFTF